MNLDNLARRVHSNASEKGFWDYMYGSDGPAAEPFIFYAKQLMMISSEATEVMEALRKNKGEEAVVEELADIIIRVVDLYQGLVNFGEVKSSLDEVLTRKTIINTKRPRLHGTRG